MTELIVRYAEPKPKGIADQAVIPSEVVGTLIRCKDCKYYKKWGEYYGVCLVHIFTSYTEDDGYCSKGEYNG